MSPALTEHLRTLSLGVYEACSGVAAYLEERGCLTEPAAVMQVLDKLDESLLTRLLHASYLHAS